MIIIKDNKFVAKTRINKNLYNAFKKVVKQNKTTIQSVLESSIKDYVLDNVQIFKDDKNK